jgi:NADP-dependent 3-hydroxy acid dehydrogenase YdfG
MTGVLSTKVIAIPTAVTPTGAAVAKLVAVEQGRLALGATTAADLKSAEGLLLDQDIAYPIQVDLERAKSVDEYFKIAIGQFGRIDAIVLEMMKAATRTMPSEKALGLGARRLLHCLDAAIRYCDGDLHIITISSVAGPFAVPVATAFLSAKLATGKLQAPQGPALRMSVISPFDSADADQDPVARTVLHVLREPRTPDITEKLFWRRPQQPVRRSKPLAPLSKIMATT